MELVSHTVNRWCAMTGNRYPVIGNLAIALFLAFLTLVLHGSALDGFWRFDDGYHLRFAVEYTPWQYFFQPEISRVHSGAHVTPWNVFFYDINLSLFGFDPEGHYAHLLFVIWATSVATFLVVRLWLNWWLGALGAVLFLLGAPVTYVAQQLMTGHYATGLLFVELSVYAFVRGVREQRSALIGLGALFYLLSTACKEIFLPLVVVLPFLPVRSARERRAALVPFVLVTVGYAAWRYAVLHDLLGGYDKGMTDFDFTSAAIQFSAIPLVIFGRHAAGYLALALVLVLAVMAARRQDINWTLTAVVAAALLLPLLPLTAGPGIHAPDRYFYVFWWGIAILVPFLIQADAFVTRRRGMLLLAMAALIAMVGVQRNVVKQGLGEYLIRDDTIYRFALSSTQDMVLLPPPVLDYYGQVLSMAIRAERALSPVSPGRATIIHTDDQLFGLDLSRQRVFSYETSCRCMRDISERVPALRAAHGDRILPDRPMTAHLNYAEGLIRWSLGPYQEGNFEVVMVNAGVVAGVTPAPRRAGSWPMSLRQVKDLFSSSGFYLRYVSPHGWVALSPRLSFDPETDPVFDWAGRSLDLPPLHGAKTRHGMER